MVVLSDRMGGVAFGQKLSAMKERVCRMRRPYRCMSGHERFAASGCQGVLQILQGVRQRAYVNLLAWYTEILDKDDSDRMKDKRPTSTRSKLSLGLFGTHKDFNCPFAHFLSRSGIHQSSFIKGKLP